MPAADQCPQPPASSSYLLTQQTMPNSSDNSFDIILGGDVRVQLKRSVNMIPTEDEMTHSRKVCPCTPPYIMMAYVGRGGIEALRSSLRSQVSVPRQTFKQFYIKNA